MIQVLKLLGTIHDVVDAIEDGKELPVIKHNLGSHVLSVGIRETATVDEYDIMLNHSDTRKLSGILINDVLAALQGADIKQDIAIAMPSNEERTDYLVVSVSVTDKG